MEGYILFYGYGHTITAEIIGKDKITTIAVKLLSNSFGNAETQLEWFLDIKYNKDIADFKMLKANNQELAYEKLYNCSEA